MWETYLLNTHNCNYYDQIKKSTRAKELLGKFNMADEKSRCV